MTSRRVFEDRLNILFSQILNQLGIAARSEQLGKGKSRKDIIVEYQGLLIALEASYNKSDAEKDAKKRVENEPIDLAFAIHYQENIPQELSEHEIKKRIKKMQFEVKVIVPQDISQTLMKYLHGKSTIFKSVGEWIKVDIHSLCDLIRECAQFIIEERDLKEVEKEIDECIQMFVSHLSMNRDSKIIARNLYEVLFKLYGFSIGNPEEIKEVIFAQSVLALLLSIIYYETIRHAERLKSLISLSQTKTPKVALEEAFQEILRINYEAIFKLAVEILNVLPSLNALFDELIKLGSKIASKKSLLRRDLVGRVYHKVVGEWSLKKGLATYYTEIPSAYLLLFLANPKLGKVCDFACGSGTLLTAAYSVMRRNYFLEQIESREERETEKLNEDFHNRFIENCYGFEVLKYAAQITALNIAFHNPETKVRKFHIYTLPLGVREDGNISLGSLDFTRPNRSLMDVFFSRKFISVGLNREEETLSKDLFNKDLFPSSLFDLIVMNPPFTRGGGRWKKGVGKKGGLFGFILDERIRERMIEEYNRVKEYVRKNLLIKAREILNNTTLNSLLSEKDFISFQNISQAGEGLLFLYLAHKFVKENGRIAFVLPKNLLSGSSWFLARCLLLSDYHLEYVIISYDPKGYNFSYSTNLSECLIVAWKTSLHTPKDETKFVILLRKPQTSVEAIFLANELHKVTEDRLVSANGSKALVVKVSRDELLKNVDNFGKLVFLPNFDLIKLSKHLLMSEIRIGEKCVKIPLRPLNELIESIGINTSEFEKLFQICKDKVPGSLEAFKGGDEESRSSIYVEPNIYVIPLNEIATRKYEEKKGRLILPSAIWIDTAHVTVMLSKVPILSKPFYVARLKDENEKKLKALCVWYNTTFGFISILLNREEVRGRWIQLPMTHWRLTLALDVNSLTNTQLEKFDELFDEIKEKKLRRIPEQYNTKGVDPVRLEIDKKFLEIIGMEIKEEELFNIYEQLYQTLKHWIGKKR